LLESLVVTHGHHQCDFLVLGTGIAGLYFALEVAARGQVIVLTKHRKENSNTRWAQGGISAVFGPDDSIESHVKDTMSVGAGLCDPEMVKHAVSLGPGLVSRLATKYGVQFDPAPEPGAPFQLGREGGHSARRVVHHRDSTGAEISRALLLAAERHPNITILEHHDAIDLLSWHKVDGTAGCFGCFALNVPAQRVEVFTARVTVLATGGCGKVYRYTSNPPVATGDGIAMAYRIGADVGNLEFMQFHPTCLHHPDAKNFLISEALRGEGGVLERADGSPLMDDKHPLGSLAPRDVVAREIDAELKRSGDRCVHLNMTSLDGDYITGRFPGIHARCSTLGIDMRKQPIPVVPAAHYMCGGVSVDRSGRTSIPGLLAIGETALSGLHGACRLASNSLLEAVVLAEGAANVCPDFGRAPPPISSNTRWDEGAAVNSDEAVMVSANWEEFRAMMWNFVGIVRSDKRLARARRRVQLMRAEIDEYYWKFRVTPDVLDLRNIALVGDLIVESAGQRKESRGLHYTVDFPNSKTAFQRSNIFNKSGGPKS